MFAKRKASFKKVKNARTAGPALGALFSCIAQCGFSVITTALYTKRLITLGTAVQMPLSNLTGALTV